MGTRFEGLEVGDERAFMIRSVSPFAFPHFEGGDGIRCVGVRAEDDSSMAVLFTDRLPRPGELTVMRYLRSSSQGTLWEVVEDGG